MRRLVLLLAVSLAMGWMPVTAAQATETIIKTPDGLELKMGLSQKNPFFSLSGLDLTKNVPACSGGDCNFRSITVPDTALGKNQLGVWNFSNLLVDLEKGPVLIHFNLEVEATLDAANVDVNNINLERAVVTYKTGLIGDLNFGFEVHLFDPEGGLIYQDEDPGVWLIGRQGPIGWNLGFHKRFSGVRGKTLFTNAAPAPAAPAITGLSRKTDVDANILEGRVDIDLPVTGAKLTVSPLLLVHFRHTPQFGDVFACPTGTCTGVTQTENRPGQNARATIFYPGMVASSTVGPLILTAEGVGMLGKIERLGPGFQTIYGRDNLDIRSLALFAEVALDLSKQGIGLTPFFNIDYRRGDRDPRNKTLGGYVDVSDLSTALRKDGFNKQSISSLGPQVFGAGGEAAWGFNTHGRGIGPSLGGIIADEGVATNSGNSSTLYNSRWGKGDNPGLIKLSAGVLGKLNRQWDAKGAVSFFRFDTTEPIKEEACQNHHARALAVPDCTDRSTLPDISKNMGVEFNANVGWSPYPAIHFKPFISVFVPMDAASDIHGLLIDSHNKRSVYMGGLEFRAEF